MTTPLIDMPTLEELGRQLGRDRLRRVASIQLDHGRGLLAKLAALEKPLDPQEVRLIAHQLAGSSGALGMVRLGDTASALEAFLLGGTQVDLQGQVDSLWSLGIQSHDALEAQIIGTA